MRVAPDDPRLVYRGAVQVQHAGGWVTFGRPSDSPFAVDSPCVVVAFRTSSQQVTVHLRYAARAAIAPEHHVLNSTGVVLIDEAEVARFTRERDDGEPQALTFRSPWPGQRAWKVVLPYADAVAFGGLELGDLVQGPAEEGPVWVAYGDSITQGFIASAATQSYPWRIARRCGFRLRNLGFGSRRCTASDGALIAAQAPDLVTVLIGVNDCLNGVTLEDFGAQYQALLARLAAVPVYVITPLACPGAWHGTERLESFREVVRSLAGPGVTVVEGPNLVPAEGHLFADGLHPNDAGFEVMAERLAAVLAMG